MQEMDDSDRGEKLDKQEEQAMAALKAEYREAEEELGEQKSSNRQNVKPAITKQGTRGEHTLRHRVGNVHEMREVTAQASGQRRVGMKIDYYRDTTKGYRLVDRIDEHYVTNEVSSGNPVLNISRLKDIVVHRNRMAACDRSSAASPASERSPSPHLRPRIMSPDLVAAHMEEKATEREKRAEKVKASAREIAMDMRVEQLLQIKNKEARSMEARRVAPWFTLIALSWAAASMRKMNKVCHHAIHAVTSGDASKRHTLMVGQRRFSGTKIEQIKIFLARFQDHGPGNDHGHAHAKGMPQVHIDNIYRIVHRRLLDCESTRARDAHWKDWRKTLRSAMFVVRLMRPVRVHKQMDLIKDFIDSTWQSYRLVRATHKFTEKVKILQNGFRCSYRIMTTLRMKVLVPQIWALETEVLAGLMAVSAETVKAEIAAYMTFAEVDKYKLEVATLMELRSQIWMGKLSLAEALQAQVRKPRGETVENIPTFESRVGDRAAGSVIELLDSKRVLVVTAMSGIAEGTQEAADEPRSPRNAGKERDPDKPRLQRGPSTRNARGDKRGKGEIPGMNSGILKTMERFRLSEEERISIAEDIWRRSLDRWWQAYKAWKITVEHYHAECKEWGITLASLGTERRHMWPEPPAYPPFPSELLKLHTTALVQEITRQLKAGKAKALF
eukprot:gnl/TRDRNA2_/TRDRNA2_166000_c0_seq1.p1 gnl/TRDRNA2_/TRDRNA2_166000_c0~~gnl/TRDRNA2_/TRDRNA2_166000_c0_seq1.p1  ORF type:complete len:670 (+),score=131.46 gnl/TRDRNA2_/TRDRNA2_166000_c0_seq1:126-2135(+)